MDLKSIQGNLTEKWQNPKVRYGAIAAILLGTMTIIALNTEDMDTGGSQGPVVVAEKKKKVEANFFTQSGADDLEQGRMDEIYDLMEEQLAEREKAIDEREEEMRQMESRLMQELESLRFSQNDIKRDLEIQKKASETIRSESVKPKSTFTPPSTQQSSQQANLQQALPQNPMADIAQQQMGPRVIDRKRVGIRTIDSKGDRFLDSAGTVTELSVKDIPVEPEPVNVDTTSNNSKEKAEKAELFLPAGSIVSGVLITGMDVPTGNSVMRDPFPSILRVKQEALLPNNFSADIRECVIIASAVGDMASTRAYLRAEAISCVTDEGKAVEANLNAFAVGPDGRNGIPGRLVSKNGEAALKSAWAGFLSGMSGLAGQSTFNVGDNETGVFGAFQSPEYMSALASSAALQGAGDALERLAEYYIEIAEQMKPYIEVNPGINIDFIIQRGTSLRLE